VISGVLDLARDGVVPGGTERNHAFVKAATDWGVLTGPEQLVMADAQTSGGLLIATRAGDALAAALREGGVGHAEIGEVIAGPSGAMTVTGHLRE
jgi:selenide,water dikinase